jgi:hypothetical protein
LEHLPRLRFRNLLYPSPAYPRILRAPYDLIFRHSVVRCNGHICRR